MAKPPRKQQHAADLDAAKQEFDSLDLDDAIKLTDRLQTAIDVLKRHNVPISARTINVLTGIWYNNLLRAKDEAALAIFRANSAHLRKRRSSTKSTSGRNTRTESGSTEQSEARMARLEQKLQDYEIHLEHERAKYQQAKDALESVYAQNLALRGEIALLKAESLRNKEANAASKELLQELSEIVRFKKKEASAAKPDREDGLSSSQFDDDLL